MYNLLRRLSTGTLPTWVVGERDVINARALECLGLVQVAPSRPCSASRQRSSVQVATITPAGTAALAAMTDDIDPDSASRRYAELRPAGGGGAEADPNHAVRHGHPGASIDPMPHM